MNHKYSTFLLLALFLGFSTYVVLGELVSDEISYGLCPDANINDGEVWLIVGYNNVWNCTRFDNSAFNISVNNVTVYVNSTDYWGDYYFGDYNLSNFNLSGYVPYTGATQDVDLGANGLSSNDLTASSITSSSYINFVGTSSPVFSGVFYTIYPSSSKYEEVYSHGTTPMNVSYIWSDPNDDYQYPMVMWKYLCGVFTTCDWVNITERGLNSKSNITTGEYFIGDGSKLTGITSGGTSYYPNNDTIINTTNGLAVNTTEYYLLKNNSGQAYLDAPTLNISSSYTYIGDEQSSLVSTSTGSSSDKVVIYKNNPGLTSRVLMVLMNFNHTSNSNLPSSGLNAFAWHTGTGNLTRTADFGGFAAGRYLAILNGDGGVSRGGGVSAKGLDNRGSTFRSSGFSYDFNAEGCIVSTQNITTCVNFDTTPHQDTSTGTIQNAIGLNIKKQTVGTLTNKEIFMDGASGIFFRNLADDNIYISSPENNNLTIHASDTTNIDSVLRLTPRSSAPTGNLGDIYVDSDTNELCFYDGSSWTGLKAGGTCA